MKKFIVFALTVLLTAGCGSGALLKESAGAMADSLKTKTSAAALSKVSIKQTGNLTAPAFSSQTSANGYDEFGVSPSDFYEFSDFFERGIPSDAEYPALKYMEGGWRYYLDRQDLDLHRVSFNEFGLADVSLNYDRETVTIVLHPRLAGDGYELYPETDEEVGYQPIEGGFNERGELVLEGNNLMVGLNNYFAWSGREYVMGEIWYPDSYCGYFFLTRGQQ